MGSSDDLTVDAPGWSAVAHLAEGRFTWRRRLNASYPFARITGALSPLDPASVPDRAVVDDGWMEDYPAALRRVTAEATPVLANDVFFVFARRPTFGSRSRRGSVSVNALSERIGRASDGGIPAPPAAPPPPVVLAAPPAVAAPDAGFTPARPPTRPGSPRFSAARAEGRLLAIADNGTSLGRCRPLVVGHPTDAGLSPDNLRGTPHAMDVDATRAEGLSLDPWRATCGPPRPEQAPGTPGGDVLDAAGVDAEPDHAAVLLVLAVRA